MSFVCIFILDPKSVRVGELQPNTVVSLITLLTNFPFIVFFLTFKKLTCYIPSSLEAVLLSSVIQMILITALAVIVEGKQCSNLSSESVFGWLNPEYFFYITFVYGLICGVGGTVGALMVL